MPMSVILRITSSDKQTKDIPLNAAQTITVEKGARYKLLDATGQKALTGMVLKKKGEALVIELEQQPLLQIEQFYAAEQQAEVDVASSLEQTELVHAASTVNDSGEVVWQSAAPTAEAAHSGSSPGMAIGGVALGGMALGGGGGGGGAVVVNNIITGTIVAGPISPTNDLKVVAYKADGKTVLGEGSVDTDGKFTIAVGDYKGVVIAKVINSGGGKDYLDEATNSGKDLNAELFSMGVVGASSNTVTLNVNVLTTVAYQKAVAQAGSAPLSEETVSQTNSAIAKAFGLNDLHATTIVTVNGGSNFNAADGLSAGENYGAILAALSGADLNNGGDTQATINKLVTGIKLDAEGVTLDKSVQTELIAGGQVIKEVTNGVVPEIKDSFPPSITSTNTAAINENTAAGTVVYTTVASDSGTVSYSLKAATGDVTAFSIESSTGAVTLINSPNFEAKASYSFTVVATDTAGNSSEQAVTLAINNLDEVAPSITSTNTANSIMENSGAGQIVYTATSTDSADIATGTTSYTLKTGVGDAAAFSINSSTGAVTLTGNPDFEIKPSYSFTIVATDAAGNSSEQAVTLAINNLDEVAPTITSAHTASNINENSGSGQIVYTATSTDSADIATGTTSYSLKAGAGDAAAFSINSSTGAVTLIGNPDFETKPSYSFTVVATDAAGNSSEQAVTLAINNLDEVAPTITSANTASIKENSGAGQIVYTATSTDSADIATDTTRYSLKTGIGDAAAFSINSSTGAVTLIGNPDFETKPSYSFTVVATDAAGNSSEQALTLAINNLDEVAPTITSANTASIKENSGAGQIVYTATSTDTADIATGATSYSLKPDTGHANAFRINSQTGAVVLIGQADYEVQPSYDFTVLASDAAGNASSQSVHLAIDNIADEVAPQAKTPYTSSIALNIPGANSPTSALPQLMPIGKEGSYLVAWHAPDKGILLQKIGADNRLLGDAIQLGNKAMGPNDGYPRFVELGNAGDRLLVWQESDHAYAQKIKADGSLISSAIALGDSSVPILYLNDVVGVGTGGAFVVTWMVSDTTHNIQVYIQQFNAEGSPVSGPLKLDAPNVIYGFNAQIAPIASTGDYLVTWVGLATGLGGTHTYIQKFKADGAAAGSATMLAPIEVNNGSDVVQAVSPIEQSNEFVLTRYSEYNHVYGLYTQKMNADGSVLGDAFKLSTINQHISNNGPFFSPVSTLTTIGESAAYVVAWVQPDNNGVMNIVVQQFAADGKVAGSPVKLETPKMNTFSGMQVVSIDHNAGYVVTWVGKDGDGDSSIFVQQFNPNGSLAGRVVKLEAIGVSNGYEVAPQISEIGSSGEYVVTWAGVDAAGKNSVFTQKFNPDGTLNTTISTANSNSVIVQSNEQGTAYLVSSSVQVNSLNDILNAADELWNSVDIPKADTEVNIPLAGLSDGLYRIYVVDATGNLSAPAAESVVIGPYVNQAHPITENSGTNQIIYTPATASEGVTYSLKPINDASAFSINVSTGAVSLLGNPDFEAKSHYQFTILATDAAANVHEQALILAIRNLDETAPIFTSPDIAPAIAENSGVAQVVYTATSLDADAVTGATRYSLKPEVGDVQHFSINATTGAVSLIGNPDFETKASYSFTVVAQDAADNRREQVVTLPINNQDEVAPSITSPAVQTIAENIGVGQLVYTVTSTDSVDIATGATTYGIKARTGDVLSVRIDPHSGAVRLIHNPDFEAKPSYNFTVVAQDAAGNHSEQAVTLSVTDQAEAAPAVKALLTLPAITENTGAGQLVYTPPTDTPAGSLVYDLKEATGDVYAFNIDHQTGVVTLINDPDFEAKPSYNFTLVTRDNAGNVTEQPVSLAITNLDDTAPTITSSATAPSISENTGAGQVVYTVTSTDTADVATGATTYSLKAVGDYAAFNINANTGAVSLIASPDYETKANYNFTVVATDTTGRADSKQVSLAINNIVDEIAPQIVLPYIPAVKLEAPGVSNGTDYDPQITALGSAGEYVVTWADSNTGVLTQKFNADGSTAGTVLKLGTFNDWYRSECAPQIAALGNTGAYVVTWAASKPNWNELSIYVQKVNADGSLAGSTVMLEATGVVGKTDLSPQITALGNSGTYVVIWSGENASYNYGDTSIYVQKFNTDGSVAGSAVKLDATGVVNARDLNPQVISVGNTGEYVVAWSGMSSSNYDDTSIYVQKFNADGSTVGGAAKLDATGVATRPDASVQISAVGGMGEYVVTWSGEGASYGDSSVYVQKFNADGTAVGAAAKLDATGVSYGDDITPQVTAIGDTGAYVVTWSGVQNYSSEGSIYIQKFNADGSASGNAAKLDASSLVNLADWAPQITAVGNTGEYVATWVSGSYYGAHDSSVYVQKFNVNGSVSGNVVKLDAPGVILGADTTPQISAVGNAGEFAITWSGKDADGDNSIYVQKFNADGTPNKTSPALANNNDFVTVQSNEIGTVYLVNNSITVNKLSDITSAANNLWNDVKITQTNTDTAITQAGLVGGIYQAYAADETGNLSTVSEYSIKLNNHAAPVASMQGPINSSNDAGSIVSLQPYVLTANDKVINTNAQSVVVDSSGAYVQVRSGIDSDGDSSVFVQKFNANGSTAGSEIKLEATGVTNQTDYFPQVCPVGISGEYVVTWRGYNSADPFDVSIYVQKFNADGSLQGTAVKLDGTGIAPGDDFHQQIIAVGSTGEFVVTWSGHDLGGDPSIYVQKFSANGTKAGNLAVLEVPGVTTASDMDPQITTIGNTGEYAVGWLGRDTTNQNPNIYVQKFKADGSTTGSAVKLNTEAVFNDVNGIFSFKQLTYSGDDKFVASWTGGNGLSPSTYTYQFKVFDYSLSNNDKAIVQSTELGTVYLVHNSVQVTSLNDLLQASDALWNKQIINQANSNTDMSLVGLAAGRYNAYAVDNAGNLSQPSTQEITISLDHTAPVATFVTPHLQLKNPIENGNYISGPLLATLGSDGKYSVAWSSSYSGAYVQTFNADGSLSNSFIKIDGSGFTAPPQISTVGTAGAYVMVWSQVETNANDDTIYVQKMNADGTKAGNVILLEATGVTTANDYEPRITALGSTGEYVVVWRGEESLYGERSIYVQKFNADGTVAGNAVMLEATGVTNGHDVNPYVTAINSSGAYVVAWSGRTFDASSSSIYVQRFNADGTVSGNAVKLEAPTSGYYFNNEQPQITALGNSGAYVVTWTANYGHVYLQKFNADGSTAGAIVKLEAPGILYATYSATVKVAAVGSDGDYVVSWDALDANYDNSVYVQKFHADGSKVGVAVMLEATGINNATDGAQQIAALGNTGEYVVTWAGNGSIYVQKFNTTGEKVGTAAKLDATSNSSDHSPQIIALGNTGEYVVSWGQNSLHAYVQHFNADGTMKEQVKTLSNGDGITVQSNELGMAYLVNNALQVSSLSDINKAADDMWNSVAITTVNSDTGLLLSGLKDGVYAVYSSDNAGNLSAKTERVITLDSAPTISKIEFSNAVGMQNNYLNVGDVVTVSVTMSENVNVTGTPTIDLNVGGHIVSAAYSSGSASDTLKFEYTVQAGQTDEDGIRFNGTVYTWSVHGNINLNGGTIADATGHSASLGFDYFGAINLVSAINLDPLRVDTTLPIAGLNTTTLANSGYAFAQSSEIGKAYLVNNTVSVNSLSDITHAADHLWNSTTIDYANTSTKLAAAGLIDGTYRVYSTDQAGNLSVASSNQVTVATHTSTVVFDLADGVSSNHSARTFQPNVDYTIYIQVPSAEGALSTDGVSSNVNATWGTWSGVNNLGAGDQIILVGNGAALRGGNVDNVVDGIKLSQKQANWTTAHMNVALRLDQQGNLKHIYSGVAASLDLWNGTVANLADIVQNQPLFLSAMPQQVLTSQGLV